MTITFVPYRGQIASEEDQAAIVEAVYSLANKTSFYTNLQVIYNNPEHFQTGPFGLCTHESLSVLAQTAKLKTRDIEVQGNVHENFHISGVVLSLDGSRKLAVYDSYIRIKFRDILYHILLRPPRLSKIEPFGIKLSPYCSIPTHFIPPIFE